MKGRRGLRETKKAGRKARLSSFVDPTGYFSRPLAWASMV